MTTQLRSFGNRGESLVVAHLKKQGFVIVARNYAQRGGEIDIIAERRDVRAFVEVKTRADRYFSLSELITRQKQRKIIATAYQYNATHGWKNNLVHRFDVALLVEQNGSHELTYIPNAFAPGEGHL
ncbi:MAG: YraN family protein [Candidatus Dependentiae bacterium]|jgi:putative endonuclease|nr:YraN family protein [Candidatus Dependentiae bacterium]